MILCTYAELDREEIAAHRPTVVFVDEHNRQLRTPDAPPAHEAQAPELATESAAIV